VRPIDDDITGDELRDEIMAERFPHWRGVLNEAARARFLRGLADEVKPESARPAPWTYADNDLTRARRRRILREELPGEYGRKSPDARAE
jgi:hypothetical protein